MTQTRRVRSHLAQFECAIRILEHPGPSDISEELDVGLMSRDDLETRPELRRQLTELDAKFAAALAHASPLWRRRAEASSHAADVAQSAWWQNILRLAAEESEPLKKAVGH